MKFLINAFWGFCMALADSVPGISGGTIAFILGFYEKLINALNDIFFGGKNAKLKAFIFLLKLLVGWIVGMVLASLVLSSLFTKKIYVVSSLFLGFVIFSIPLIIKEEKKALSSNYKCIIFLILGIVIVLALTYFNPTSGSSSYINIKALSLGKALYIFIAGMIAISAMILPGISGSTLLLIFGLYMPIMDAISKFIHFDFSYFWPLFIFGLGIIFGIVLIIKVIKVCIERYRSATVYLIIGLMIGSIYAIIEGPTTLEVPTKALSLETFKVLPFVIGGIVIYGLEKVKEIIERGKYDEDESK